MRMMLTVPANALFELRKGSGELSTIAGGYFDAGNDSTGTALKASSEILRDLKL
jgi:hypothetical protein